MFLRYEFPLRSFSFELKLSLCCNSSFFSVEFAYADGRKVQFLALGCLFLFSYYI